MRFDCSCIIPECYADTNLVQTLLQMRGANHQKSCGQLLINDFTQCMYTHRHYDTMNWNITKFAFCEILVAIGACWSVFNWDLARESSPNLKWIVMSIICGASIIFGIISIITIVKNRVYFVRTSRHVNELRHHVLLRQPFGFKNESHFWEDSTYPKMIDKDSTQFLSLYMLIFLNMCIAAALVFSILNLFQFDRYYLMAVASILVLGASWWLINKIGKKKF